MLSGATLNAMSASVSPSRIASSPVVLVDGQVHLGLSVLEIERRGPLDERSATIVANRHDADPTSPPPLLIQRSFGDKITIASPIAIEGGANRLRVEISGGIDRTRHVSQQLDHALIVDDWSVELDTPISGERACIDTVAGAQDL